MRSNTQHKSSIVCFGDRTELQGLGMGACVFGDTLRDMLLARLVRFLHGVRRVSPCVEGERGVLLQLVQLLKDGLRWPQQWMGEVS